MRKIVQKNEVSIMKLKCQERPRMQDFAPFIPELLGALSGPQNPRCPARQMAMLSVRINLPATFQFSPATSTSIDIPVYARDTSLHVCYHSYIDVLLIDISGQYGHRILFHKLQVNWLLFLIFIFPMQVFQKRKK
jgi:hypothetical protein